MRPKKLRDQVLVITGATSGIGLCTAEVAVARGARVVLAAANEPELAMLAARLNQARPSEQSGRDGERAAFIAVDASDPSAAERIAERAVDAFGGFDTWVNNTADDRNNNERLTDAPLAHMRRVFETTFWSTVNGCRVALDYLRRPGGVIINVGSVGGADQSHQGMAQVSAQAVHGFTDALRRETETDGVPVAIALVTSASSDSFEDVARAVVRSAERPLREVVVGSLSRVRTALAALAAMTPRRDYGRVKSFDVGRAAPILAIGALVAAGVVVSKRS